MNETTVKDGEPINSEKIVEIDEESENYDINRTSGKRDYKSALNMSISAKKFLKTPKAYNPDDERIQKTNKKITEGFSLQKEKENLRLHLALNEESGKFIETPIANQNSEKKVTSENIEVSEFYSRYNTLDKSSSFLSFKRRREQLIKESYEAFGFSFDSGIDLKKGYSKVEREKLIEKNKRNNQILTNFEINSETLIQKTYLNNQAKATEMKTNDSSSNFMQDAIIKKTRVERDKELFLEQQKKLKEMKNCENKPSYEDEISKIEHNSNNVYLSYKQRKQELLNTTNNGKYNFLFKFFILKF